MFCEPCTEWRKRGGCESKNLRQNDATGGQNRLLTHPLLMKIFIFSKICDPKPAMDQNTNKYTFLKKSLTPGLY